jgi:hypothetical protein
LSLLKFSQPLKPYFSCAVNKGQQKAKTFKNTIMKKVILSIAIAAVFASCANDKSAEQATVSTTTVTPDTSGFAQFKAWKESQEMVSDFTTEGVNDPQAVAEAKPAPVIIYRNAPVQRTPRATRPVRTSGTSNSGSSGSQSSQGGGSVSNDDVAVSQPAEIPAQKKGWSKAAKGAVIGGASGAVLGAVIGKNKAKGAIIGGVVGAAGGYIYGRSRDKKDGR